MHFTDQQPPCDNTGEFSQLVRKLWKYYKSGCLLAATTPQAVSVTAALAEELLLQHYRHFCRTLIHPAHGNKTIGSVTCRAVILHNDFTSLPQGYIEHQVALMKHALLKENREARPETFGKTVILIRESVEHIDQVSAAVEELRKLGTRTTLVATPIISYPAIQPLLDMVDGLTYGTVDQSARPRRAASRMTHVSHPEAFKS
jgi:predicted phosphoribosyltransferase